ncbi:MAG: flagellar protein FlgN [Planctomycetes bacterium]|nr:flagellar protein FlgN [Planctomycetota bacterium]
MPTIAPRKAQAFSPQAFIDHMRQEEEVLSDTLVTLRDVRAALLKNDLDRFSRALERQVDITRTTEELREKRARLLQDFARSFDQEGEAITLRSVAEALPERESEWLFDCRDRLLEMAEEAQRLNSQNAAMVHQSVEITRQVLAALTTDGASGESYDSAGARQESVGHSLIEMGG